eukprot:2123827-Lingulodinium_polyedra.AAC.1
MHAHASHHEALRAERVHLLGVLEGARAEMHGQEAAMRAEHARDLASLRVEHEATVAVLERRVQSLEQDVSFT